MISSIATHGSLVTEGMPYVVRQRLVDLAATFPDREICGFVMKDWWIEPIDNIAPVDREFYMDSNQQLHMMTEHGDDILGVYHSHPSGQDFPSPKDIEHAPRNMRYWIIAGGNVIEWEIKNGVAQTAEIDPEVLA